jgi:anti-sigma factor RsiW
MSDQELPCHEQELSCQEFVEIVTDYLDGVLDPERGALVEEHLAQCPGCQTYLAQMRVTIALLGQVREPDLTPRAWAHLRQAFRSLL